MLIIAQLTHVLQCGQIMTIVSKVIWQQTMSTGTVSWSGNPDVTRGSAIFAQVMDMTNKLTDTQTLLLVISVEVGRICVWNAGDTDQ